MQVVDQIEAGAGEQALLAVGEVLGMADVVGVLQRRLGNAGQGAGEGGGVVAVLGEDLFPQLLVGPAVAGAQGEFVVAAE